MPVLNMASILEICIRKKEEENHYDCVRRLFSFPFEGYHLTTSVLDICDTCSASHHVGMELQSRALCMTLIFINIL